jgi:transcriptional regulator with XRE-family HTH domain
VTPKRPKGFGTKMRELRQKSEMTLGDLAQRTDINIATLSLIENGKQRPPEIQPHVANMAKLFGLVDGTPEYAEFLRMAERERFSRRAVRTRLARNPGAAGDAPPEEPRIAVSVLKALLTALEQAGDRPIARLMLRTEDGEKIVVRVDKLNKIKKAPDGG